MSIIINDIAAKNAYSSIVEPNLYTNSWLIPGVTFSDKYEQTAAGIQVPKLVSIGKKSPSQPGQNLEHKKAANDLIQILLNNEYGFSQIIKDVEENAVPFELAEAAQKDNVESARESVQSSALACAIREGTISNDTEEVTAENALKKLIDARKEISNKKGTAKIVLASPDYYAKLVEGSLNKMTPTNNDKIVTTGQVGSLLGFTIFEVNDFVNGAATYLNSAGSSVTVSAEELAKIDFIMYDPRVLSYITLLKGMRFSNSPDFFGVLAQMQIDCGFKVTTPECMLIKTHA